MIHPDFEQIYEKEKHRLGAAGVAAGRAFLEWELKAHNYQRWPEGDWTVWLLLAGRGAGKTRTAAEHLRDQAWAQSGTRWLVSAPTYGDLDRVCFNGESGLGAVIPANMIDSFNKTDMVIKLVNGSIIEGISAESYERFRGPQFHGGWCDELAAWKDAEDAWDLMMMGMRLGQHPRIIATTTPKPRPLIQRLVKDPHTVVTRASTYQNVKNLAPPFQRELLKYEGTKYGRQEIYGELIDPSEAGIIQKSWFRIWPRDKPLPAFEFILMSLDTAFTQKTVDKDTGDPDPTACSVWGLFRHNGKWAILLLDCWQDFLGFPALVKRVKEERKIRYGDDINLPAYTAPGAPRRPSQLGRPTDLILIEEKGSGISLRQSLEAEGIFPWPYNPGKADKLARLHAVSHLFKAGIFWLPEHLQRDGEPRDFIEELLTQLTTFAGEGSIKHDDYVDTVSQAARYFMDMMGLTVDPPPPAEEREPEKAPVNPYSQ